MEGKLYMDIIVLENICFLDVFHPLADLDKGGKKPNFIRLMHWVFGFSAKNPPYWDTTMVL